MRYRPRLDSLGSTWTHLVSLGFAWSHVASLGTHHISKGKREQRPPQKGKGKDQTLDALQFHSVFCWHPNTARRTHARNETISRFGGPFSVGPWAPWAQFWDPTFRVDVSNVLHMSSKNGLPEFIIGFSRFPGNNSNRAGPALGSTRAGGKDAED